MLVCHQKVTIGLLLATISLWMAGAASLRAESEPRDRVPATGSLWVVPPDVRLSDLAGDRSLVLFFVRTDCPVSQRYAPEMGRIAEVFTDSARVMTVYVASAGELESVSDHAAAFYSGQEIAFDPRRVLLEMAGIEVSGGVAVFDVDAGLVYRGRVDDRYVRLGLRRVEPTRRDLVEVLAALRRGEPVGFRETPVVGCYFEPADLAS